MPARSTPCWVAAAHRSIDCADLLLSERIDVRAYKDSASKLQVLVDPALELRGQRLRHDMQADQGSPIDTRLPFALPEMPWAARTYTSVSIGTEGVCF